jgi:dolichyl-phosphate beta-glucosyltransferase
MKSSLIKFIRYSVVGVLGTILDLLSIFIFVEFFGLNILLGAILAFLIASTNNFVFNKKWTFKNREKDTPHQYVKFTLVSIIGLTLTVISMFILSTILGIWYMLSKALTSLLVLSWNFFGNKKWTFKESFFVQDKEIIATCDYTIIIPAFNEEKRIARTLNEILDYIKNECEKIEILVVDDGSTDNTSTVVNETLKDLSNFKLIGLDKNMGKGFAVKQGVLEASGKNILIIDADGATPIREFAKLKVFLNENDIVIGSRKLSDSNVIRRGSFNRKLISYVGSFFIMSLVRDIKDTQCGFKLMSKETATHLFSIQKINRFGFDIEILALAQFYNYSVAEIPIEWKHVDGSKINTIRDSARTFTEVLRIHYNFLTNRY